MLFFLFLVLGLSSSLQGAYSARQIIEHGVQKRELDAAASISASTSCPLDFDTLWKLINGSSQRLELLAVTTECEYMLQALRLVRSEYLRTTGYFYPPPNSSVACWDAFQSIVDLMIPGFDVRSTCGFKAGLMTETCKNITTRLDFERTVPERQLSDVQRYCNQSLDDGSPCKSCTESIAGIEGSYFSVPNNGNESDCSGYPFIYAAAYADQFKPPDRGIFECLFSLDFSSNRKKESRYGIVFWGIVSGCSNGFFGAMLVIWLCWTWRWSKRMRAKTAPQMELGATDSGIEIINGNARLIRFTIEEIRKATNNFSRENIIGRGGYGNVYRGTLTDGSEVALKRFKNSTAIGDEGFAHEVEVIASIRHVNLVALRGYCTASVPVEGHQRILVCDLVPNGSLYDHLFRRDQRLLGWPARQKIALGTARGLAYLHYGAQPAIIHRDVKASNILLDEAFEPKLADFGLAKFTPDGMSHMSTRVAGTLGYVAPEHALYGQLSERSDVYGFGVVLLEILSGKKAVISVEKDKTVLLTDWAWSLVKGNKVLEVVDEGIPDLAAPDVMEKYVLLAVLCSHPLVEARPTMDHVVKILDSDSSPPSIPGHPISILSEIESSAEGSTSLSHSNFTSSTNELRPFVSKLGSDMYSSELHGGR